MRKLTRHGNSGELLHRGLTYGIFILCAYSAWIRGGVHASLQWPVGILSACLWLVLFLFPAETRKKYVQRVLQDRVAWAGGIFLLLLFMQGLNNAGCVLPVAATDVEACDAGPIKWLPGSFSPVDAAEMLLWFFPALTVLLIIRNILSRRDVKTLIYLLVWNGAALACAGILQHLFGGERIMGIWRAIRSDSFATFDYPNHAAAWFYLHAALAAGLACDSEMKRKPRIRVAVFGVCFFCCMVASCLTLSRFGATVALAQLSIVFCLFLSVVKSRLRGTRAFNAYLLAGIIMLAGIALFLGAGRGSLAREVGRNTITGERSLSGDFSIRGRHVAKAGEVFVANPVFGCGGWGCDWLIVPHLPSEEKRAWMVNGRANVHCDPVQFLAEFGVVGCLCMTFIVLVIGRAVFSARRSMLWFWMSGGLAIILLHSLIDLPFRCPALLLCWCTLVAALPLLVGYRSRNRDS